MQNHFQILRASQWELRQQELPPLPGVALSGSLHEVLKQQLAKSPDCKPSSGPRGFLSIPLFPLGQDVLLWLCEPCFPSSFRPNLGAIPALANPRRLPSEASYTASAEAPEVFFSSPFSTWSAW